MDFQLSAYFVGLLTSVVTELLKLFPFLSATSLSKAATSVVVMVVGTLVAIGFHVEQWDWNLFLQVVMWSFVNYKVLIQPAATTLASPTQV